VIIPTFNEEADIEACLSCVAHQDAGPETIEVVIADGRSSDRTVARAEAFAREASFERVVIVPNDARRAAAGLSLALSHATAPIVVRVDARSRIPECYVRKVVEVLQRRPEVGVVGGAQVPLDRQVGTIGSGVARYTTGLSRYRFSATSGAADTVWMGAFRTEQLRSLGGWRSDHGINEDYELNERYRAARYVVWYEATLRSGYQPRPGLRPLARQYFSFGRSKGASWAGGATPAPRQVVLMAAPPLVAAGAVLVSRHVGVVRAMTALVLGMFALDEAGARRYPSTAPVRLASVAATLTFAGSWWTGVVSGWLCGAAPSTPRREA
jgi:glycosyltransferase involved in cell wall biosynthesis